MKGLSIEEKAKAYDEAIERAKLSRAQLLDIGEEATEIEHIFPELKESEDERIRKWLIKLLSTMQYHHCDEDREMGNKTIAWLEKQGEEKVYSVWVGGSEINKTTINSVETIDPLTGEKKITKVAALIPDPESPGGYKRSEVSPFSYYGIEIGQVAISKIAYSKTVQDQISKQQENNMSIQTKKSEALAAQQDAIKAEAEGKAKATKAKWAQEEQKATAVTKAEQEREVARLAAEQAEFEKKRIIAEGQAQAEANRLKVQAGLTPQERAEWDYKTAVGVAEALANSKVPWVPTIMFTGDGKTSNSAMDAIGLNMMLDVVSKMNKK